MTAAWFTVYAWVALGVIIGVGAMSLARMGDDGDDDSGGAS